MASADVGVDTRILSAGGESDSKMHGNGVGEEMIMLRVSKREKRSRTTFIVDGRLLKDYVETVETFCGEAISIGTIVQLFLRHVSTVDDAGRTLLSRLAAKGVRLRVSGVYISHLVGELKFNNYKATKAPFRRPLRYGTCEREAENNSPDD